jgi:hypothetical protein
MMREKMKVSMEMRPCLQSWQVKSELQRNGFFARNAIFDKNAFLRPLAAACWLEGSLEDFGEYLDMSCPLPHPWSWNRPWKMLVTRGLSARSHRLGSKEIAE